MLGTFRLGLFFLFYVSHILILILKLARSRSKLGCPAKLFSIRNNRNWNRNWFRNYPKQDVCFGCFGSISKQEVPVFDWTETKRKQPKQTEKGVETLIILITYWILFQHWVGIQSLKAWIRIWGAKNLRPGFCPWHIYCTWNLTNPHGLKEQCHEIFDLRFFHQSNAPWAPDSRSKAFLNSASNSPRYDRFFVR
jgi:hypothetical protein